MIYGYDVKINGKWYKAGEEVNSSPSFIIEPKKDEGVSDKKSYSRSEIQLMKADDLKKLAESEGIENAMETSGNQLKKILIEHFGL